MLKTAMPHQVPVPYYKDPSTTKHFAFRIKLNNLHLSWNHKVFDFAMSTGHRKNTWLYGFDPIFDFMIFTFLTVHIVRANALSSPF